MFGRSVAGLMAHFSYRAKFMIIAAIFAIPLLIMAYWLISIAHRDIQDISQQRAGYDLLGEQLHIAEMVDALYALRLAALTPQAGLSTQFQSSESAEALLKKIQTAAGKLEKYAPAMAVDDEDLQALRDYQLKLIASKRFVSIGYGLASSSEPVVPILVASLSQFLSSVRTHLIEVHFRGISLLANDRVDVSRRLAYKRAQTDLLAVMQELHQLHDASLKFFADEAYKRALDALSAAVTEFAETYAPGELSRGQLSESMALWDQQVASIISGVSRLDDLSHQLLTSQLANREQTDYLVYVSIVSLVVLVVLLSSFVFISFYRATVNTIENLQVAARLLSEGDLSARVVVHGKDEMARVSQCFNQMAEDFSQILLEVIRKMDRVETNTLKMKAASSVTSMSVKDQYHKVDEVTDSVNRLTDSYQIITGMTRRTAEFSNTARENTLSNVSQIRDAIDRLSTMADDFHATTQSLSVLEAESNRISAVLASIREIADQTNLLALNAAIEAARAGEMGRGFAVVSDEVRALAVKTQTATESVAETIDALQDSIETFIRSTQSSYNNMKSGIDDAASASDLFAKVSDEIQQIYEMSEQIASQTQQNSAATLMVRDTMHEIRGISESAHAAVMLNAESSGELAQLTHKLKDVLEHFSAQSSEDAELF